MFIIKGLNEDCLKFIEENVGSEMKSGGNIMVGFKKINEVITALQAAGFERERDFRVLP